MGRTRQLEAKYGVGRWLLVLASVTTMALLALAPPALADAPTLIHDRVDAHFTDPDFCGSGLAVDVLLSGVQTIRPDGDAFKGTGTLRGVLTNSETGASVTVRSAGQVHAEMISGDPEGVHTYLVTVTGLPLKIQTAGGEVLLRDAGVIAFLDTFDGPHLITSEVVLNKGPHPEADSGFILFCRTVLSVLD